MKNLKFQLKTALAISSLFLMVGCQQNSTPTATTTPVTPVSNVTTVPVTTTTVKPATTTKTATPTKTVTPTKPAPTPVPVVTQTTKYVAIQNMAFSNSNLSVTVGTKVVWTNKDSVPHTVTSDTGAFASNNLSNGESFSFTFDKAGTYTYHCAVHPSMKATVTVK